MSENISSGFRVMLVAADAEGLAALQPARETLETFGIACEEIAQAADGIGPFENEGMQAVIVASPDATLPAAVAAATSLPVIRVPIASSGRSGLDLLQDPATANLPAGEIPFATVAIGEAGAKNAALFIVSSLGRANARLWEAWLAFRQRQTEAVLTVTLPPE